MPAGKAILKHVGLRQAGAFSLIVGGGLHRIAADFFGRVGAQICHQLLHGVHAGFAFKRIGAQRVAVVAELFVQRFDRVEQGLALGGVGGGRLADEQRRVDGVLIPHMRAGQIPVALLKTEDEAVGAAFRFKQADLLADELEAGQGAAQLNAVFLRDRRRHIGRYDCRDRNRVFGHRALGAAGAADIIEQDDAHLVAGNQPVAALAVRHGGAAAVAVGVGAKQQIGVDGIAQFEALLHRFADFGVRVGAGREVAVRLFLLGHDGQVGDAKLAQQLAHALKPGAVERGVHKVEIGDALPAADTLGVDGVNKRIEAGILNKADTAVGKSFVILCKFGG